MIANYHTHTWRCHHATDTEREYVENAIAGGIKILGFSDHTPYRHLDDPNDTVRMETKDFEGYVNTVLALKKEYAKDIEIHLGVEVEYFPAYFEELKEFFKDYPVEYMLLGQHFLDNGINAHYSGRKTTDEKLLIQYVDQCVEAMNIGGFLYLAHPDLLRYCGDSVIFDREYRRLCVEAKKHGLPLEINFVGIRYDRWYPNRDFWKIAGEVGNTVILGADAHGASQVWEPQSEATAMDIVRDYHLNLIDGMNLLT